MKEKIKKSFGRVQYSKKNKKEEKTGQILALLVLLFISLVYGLQDSLFLSGFGSMPLFRGDS